MAKINMDYLGKYRIIDEIGHGRFSIVYRAELPLLKKTVAVKLMLPALFNDPNLIQRFIQEARKIATIEQENIAQILDLAEDQGRLFIVMEYLPRGNLHQWLEKHGRLNFHQIVQVIAEVAAALDYAHSLDVVHGDVKPGNILLAENGNAKLTDFGVLRAVETSGATSADMTRGTPYYISPEQAEGGSPTPLSDQYALGVIAYELLASKVPFEGETPLAIYLKHVREIPPSISQINPLVTSQLEAVIHRALEKDPNKRFPTCISFSQALREAVDATETKQYQDLIARAKVALVANDPETARPLIESATQIRPDETRALLADLQIHERAKQSYQNASEALNTARASAQALKAEKYTSSDPQNLLTRLAAHPTPAWKILLLRWRPALLLTLILGLLGVILGLADVTYTSLTPAGALRQATLIAQVRTSTPIYPTFTPTITFTPSSTPTATPTFSPTPTPTLTPIPSLGIGSSLIRDKDGMAMVYVPDGSFTMGSEDGQDDEKPVHTVTLAAYWIDITEVTNGMYASCVLAGVCQAPESKSSSTRSSYYGDPGYADYPVINVNWNQAKAYCRAVGGRLPTEAEWEKAARGTDGRTYPWGEAIDKTYANYFGGIGDTAPVGSYEPGKSPYGAYDLAGNVWEWVSSQYKSYPFNTSDGRDDLTSTVARVLRGGSWYYDFDLIRSAYRYWDDPSFTAVDIGFRCARSR